MRKIHWRQRQPRSPSQTNTDRAGNCRTEHIRSPLLLSMGSRMCCEAGLTLRLLLWYNPCMKQGEAPEKNMTFRLPIALMERLRTLAEHHHRSLVGELLVAIEEYLHREERKPKRD